MDQDKREVSGAVQLVDRPGRSTGGPSICALVKDWRTYAEFRRRGRQRLSALLHYLQSHVNGEECSLRPWASLPTHTMGRSRHPPRTVTSIDPQVGQ